MHERALMDDLARRLRELSDSEGGAPIVRVEVWLGALSHMTPAHFEEHFEELARDGPAEGAALVCAASKDPAHPDATGVRLLRVAFPGAAAEEWLGPEE